MESEILMKDNYTHICLVVDRSGSMMTIYKDMNGAILQLMQEQVDAQIGDITVDVITFDSDIEVVYESVNPADVIGNVIVPRGSTALNDAIGFAINRLGNKFKIMSEQSRPDKVIVVIVTDGGENASKEYSQAQVKAMVEEQTTKWNWTFMYLAANVDAFGTGAGYGFDATNTMGYVATASGTHGSYSGLSSNITRTRSGLDSGFTDEEREVANGE
jgi:uncharacterized protein YegL